MHSNVRRPGEVDFLTSRALKLASDNDKVKELCDENSQITAAKGELMSDG